MTMQLPKLAEPLPEKAGIVVPFPTSEVHRKRGYERLGKAIGSMQSGLDYQQREITAFRTEIRTLGESLIETAQSFRRYRARLRTIDMSSLGKKSRRLAVIMARCETQSRQNED